MMVTTYTKSAHANDHAYAEVHIQRVEIPDNWMAASEYLTIEEACEYAAWFPTMLIWGDMGWMPKRDPKWTPDDLEGIDKHIVAGKPFYVFELVGAPFDPDTYHMGWCVVIPD